MLIACATLNRKKQVNQYLLAILISCSITEILVPLFNYYKYPSGVISSLGVIMHHGLWIVLLTKVLTFRKEVAYILLVFWTYGIVNLFFIEGIGKFNYSTFVFGAFIYLFLYTYGSFYQLRNENMKFFLSYNYMLLFAPVTLLFGLSFMFAFRSRNVTSTLLLPNLKLYDFVIYYVNIIYYVLVNLYIYRDKTARNIT